MKIYNGIVPDMPSEISRFDDDEFEKPDPKAKARREWAEDFLRRYAAGEPQLTFRQWENRQQEVAAI